ncbi:hypothetical protein L3X38_032693 [Prunus dulcis]|uniref:RNase H type-1 domain-containing protein n=1 Tax=Prunus dulcis TaxID=3755 RepID=A0AAD4VFN3_PRUDU|nr:hypothetical protein L3X38_032693 [Prunus dulcis]
MSDISHNFISHKLSISPTYKPVRQKFQSYDVERYEAMRANIDKLQTIGFIREATYPLSIAPNLQLVDATAGHDLLSFMDAYSRYNQIFMHPADSEHATFIADRGLYCCNVMSFGLKNTGATYHRLVNRIFAKHIGSTIEQECGAIFVLTMPKRVKIEYALRFSFKTSNNEGECEAHLAGLRLAKSMSAKRISIHNDSKLIVNQIIADFAAKDDSMSAYLSATHDLLDNAKGAWPEKLPEALWVIRTSFQTSTGETPFSLTFGSEAVVPVEIGEPSYKTESSIPEAIEAALALNLDLIEERRVQANLQNEAYKQRVSRYYDSRVRLRSFKIGD